MSRLPTGWTFPIRPMRHEFSKATKQAALRRSGGVCEASGVVYGLPAKTRCTRLLSAGVDFDHWPLPAHADNSDGLENCMVVCRICHKHKTAHFDIPAEAKIKRIRRARGPVELRKVRLAIPARQGGYSKGRPLAGTKASGLRKRISGPVERR